MQGMAGNLTTKITSANLIVLGRILEIFTLENFRLYGNVQVPLEIIVVVDTVFSRY